MNFSYEDWVPRHVIISLVEAFNVVGVVLEKPMKLLFVESQLIRKGDIICHKQGFQS